MEKEIVLFIISILCSSVSIIQIIKIFKRKSAKDFSLILWIMYEIKLLSLIILSILENAVFASIGLGYSLVMNTAIMVLIFIFGNKE